MAISNTGILEAPQELSKFQIYNFMNACRRSKIPSNDRWLKGVRGLHVFFQHGHMAEEVTPKFPMRGQIPIFSQGEITLRMWGCYILPPYINTILDVVPFDSLPQLYLYTCTYIITNTWSSNMYIQIILSFISKGSYNKITVISILILFTHGCDYAMFARDMAFSPTFTFISSNCHILP